MEMNLNSRERGQAIVVIALMLVVLMAFLALAVDGGAAYAHRRTAQNATDAAALAGAVVVASGSQNASEADVLSRIYFAINANGIATSDEDNDVNVWYIDNRGLRISEDQVGTFGWIPDCEGAVGVEVEVTLQFDAFVANLIGRDQLAARSDSGAMITFANFCSGWTLWADCPNCGNTTLHFSGSDKTVTGAGIHSNDGLHVTGAQVSIVPPLMEFGDAGCVDTGSTICPPIGLAYQVDPQAMPQLYAWEDFLPGGYWWNDMCQGAFAAKCHYGDIMPDNPLHDGLYVIREADLDQQVDFANAGMHVTFALLNGDVQLTANEPELEPFVGSSPIGGSKALFAVFNGNVGMAGNSHIWNGIIFAPHGEAQVTGADDHVNDGSVYAWTIHLTGARTTINHSGYWCPPEEGNVILLW